MFAKSGVVLEVLSVTQLLLSLQHLVGDITEMLFSFFLLIGNHLNEICCLFFLSDVNKFVPNFTVLLHFEIIFFIKMISGNITILKYFIIVMSYWGMFNKGRSLMNNFSIYLEI